MPTKRLNKQQQSRIEKKQQAYSLSAEQSDLAEGLVIAKFNHILEIEDHQGRRITCVLRQHLPALAAGDRVLWQASSDNQGTVVSLCPRTSVLMRKHLDGKEKPVAANITQLVIVLAVKPEISWVSLDSYLIMAGLKGLHPLLVLNKTDLPSGLAKNRLLADYVPLGYHVLFTQKNDADGQLALQQALKDQVNVFVGQSGVGKSSLIKGLLPHEQNIVTGDISQLDLGRHTTSHSRYYHLPLGGALIDSPGVREWGLCKMESAQIAACYPEFAKWIAQCRFRNCNHQDSLGCALKEAVEKGLVSPLRYENFKKLYEVNAK